MYASTCTDSVGKSIALSCYADVASVQVVAIYITDTYDGGCGKIASVTMHAYSSLVGIHEIGQTFFGLQTLFGLHIENAQYYWDYDAEDEGPNCDRTPGYPRWSDLLEIYPNLCTYKGVAVIKTCSSAFYLLHVLRADI